VQCVKLGGSADGNEDALPGQWGVGRWVGQERNGWSGADREQQDACGRGQIGLAHCASADGGPRRDEDLLHPKLRRFVVHNDVQELGDVRLQCEGGHPASADQLRIHRAVRSRPEHFWFRGFGARSGDDDQLWSQRSTRQRHVDVVRVGVESGDQRPGVGDAGRRKHRVVSDIAHDIWMLLTLEPHRVTIDDDDCLAGYWRGTARLRGPHDPIRR
jgi:hypothetical protein